MKPDYLNAVPYVFACQAEVAGANPSAPFLTEEMSGNSCTRKQADALSAQVYGFLARRGIGAEDFVMIRLPRDPRPFIATLGAWKADAAFTVLEDTYASERIETIRKNFGCRLVIDEAAWREILSTEPLPGFRQADELDACFAIYTSGSAGKPKGVLQEYGKIKLNTQRRSPSPATRIMNRTSSR